MDLSHQCWCFFSPEMCYLRKRGRRIPETPLTLSLAPLLPITGAQRRDHGDPLVPPRALKRNSSRSGLWLSFPITRERAAPWVMSGSGSIKPMRTNLQLWKWGNWPMRGRGFMACDPLGGGLLPQACQGVSVLLCCCPMIAVILLLKNQLEGPNSMGAGWGRRDVWEGERGRERERGREGQFTGQKHWSNTMDEKVLELKASHG